MAGESRLTPLAVVLSTSPPPSSDRYVVALSGGPDSAVAAHIAISMVGAGQVSAVHVDHGLPASPEMLAAAQAVAMHLGLDLTVVSIDVAPGPGWEARARDARLDALRGAAGESGVVVTGHHADDQAETVLANLLRGAGSHGLGGMESSTGDRWWRPLLPSTRAAIRETADELGLPYVDDPANQDMSLGRNVLRHSVIPALDQVRPGISERLVRTAGHLAADEAALEDLAAGVKMKRDREALLVPLSVLRTLAAPVATRVIRRAIRTSRPPYPGTAAEVERVTRVAAGFDPVAELEGGLIVADEGAYLAFYARAEDFAPEPVALSIPGSVSWNGWRVAAELLEAPRPLIGRSRVIAMLGRKPDCLVRSADPSEKIDIGIGSKRVHDTLAEHGVPRRLRAGWPVLAVNGKIAWVAGVRIASWCRQPTGTGALVLLSLDPEEP